MNQNHQIILSTCYVRIEKGSYNTLVYFIPQEDNLNGVDFIISYRFFQTEFLKKFKLSPSQSNDNQYVFQGFQKGIILKKINQISAISYVQIFEQLLQIILICHQNQILAKCLTIENIYIDLENYQIYLLEFGFLPRLPSFINQCHINTDIVVIQEIMKFLDSKVQQTKETRCIQEKLAQQNLDYYKLFDMQILNQELKNQGRIFYGQQFQSVVPKIEEKIELYDNLPLKDFINEITYTTDYKNSIKNLLDYLLISVHSILNEVKFKQVIIFMVSKILRQLQYDLQQNIEPQFFQNDIDWSLWRTEAKLTDIQNKIFEALAELRRVEREINCNLKSFSIDFHINQIDSEKKINQLENSIMESINHQEQRLGFSILFCIKLFKYQYQQIENNFCEILNCRKGIQSILYEIKYGQQVDKIKDILES